MKSYIRRPEVETDLARYTRHIARDNPAAAVEFVHIAERAFGLIAQFPTLGRLRRWRDPRLAGVRSRPLPRPFSAWIVFYRETAEAVELVRVLHGAVDLASRLTEPPENG